MENNNKEESREFYVYKHIRKDNNTCFYVGKGKGYRMYIPKRNKHFNRIRKKYGCYVVKIKENLTEKEAFALEREIIEDYVFVFGYGINIKGYRDYSDKKYLTNCTWGGEGVSGYKHSEETKQRIREAEKGKSKNAGEKNGMWGKPSWNKGKKLSEETRKKMSENSKGKNAGKPASNRNKVVCITTCKIFDCVKDASNYYNIARTNISKCCIGRKQSAGKLQDGTKLRWKYLKDYDNDCKGILINPIINK